MSLPLRAPRWRWSVAALSALLASAARAAGPDDDSVLLPRPAHVVVVVEENRSFDQIVGSPDTPYIGALAAQGALFTASYGIAHPSQPNYIALFSGSTHGVSGDSCVDLLPGANLGSQLLAAGFGFAGYSESMPMDGWRGCEAGPYKRKHNPWSDFRNLGPEVNLRFSRFPADFAALPTVSFVVPDLIHDMHDGSVRGGDAWLRQKLDAYVQWATTNDSLLILTWDEDDKSSGNRIATIFAGPMVRTVRTGRRIDHYAVLRTIEEMYGLAPLGAAARARVIDEVWAGPRVTSEPTAVATVGVPFHLGVTTDAAGPVSLSAATPLPPGLGLDGSAIDGVPTADGTWVTELRATDAAGRGGQRMRLVVVRDTDGDGFDDDLETALGADPADPSSTPRAGAPATPGGALAVTRRSVTLRFLPSPKSDTIALRGTIELPAAFAPGGARVTVDAGGVVQTFTLRANGTSRRDAAHPASSLRLRRRRGAASAPFELVLRGSFAARLADEGLTSQPAASRPAALLLSFLLDGALSRTVLPLRYSAGAHGTGTAR